MVLKRTTRMSKVTRQNRYRRICFTLNNYTDEEYDSLKEMDCKWMIMGKETCPQTGTHHIQGAIVLNNQKTLSTLKSMPGLRRAHMEPMMGTVEQSLAYCSKQDPVPFQKGDIPQPGKRTDLMEACESLKEGKTLRDIALDNPTTVVKYHKGLISLRALLFEGTRTKPTVFWLHGDTGTGKTRSAVELGEQLGGSYWISSGSLRWFDGYDGQRVAILDDFRCDSCEFNFLLRLLDRYNLRVEYKGGFTDWRPEIIIVTSCSSPTFTYSIKPNDDVQQLLRRIDHVIEFDKTTYEKNPLSVLLGDYIKNIDKQNEEKDNQENTVPK